MAGGQAADTESCSCALCALKIDFSIDPHLLGELERHNCVPFAGAGVSTETGYTHPFKLYDQIKSRTDCDDSPKFSKLVDIFEARPNGRLELIQLIVERFSYIDSFRELKGAATRFHRELATMPYFPAFVTTNWDTYFEDYIAATPFVYEGDVAFWDAANRPLLKIHGSIDNYASIVASSEDYAACEQRLATGVLGAVLKQIFATKTLLFFGYSATDQDFLSIYGTVRTGLGAFARTHYLISPYLTPEDEERLSTLNIVGVRTDATHFLQVVKEHMSTRYPYAKDESFAKIGGALDLAYAEHFGFTDSFRPSEAPHLVFATVYQDGVIHALQRIIDMRKTGEYSDLHRLSHQLDKYEEMISEYLTKRDYWEYAYFSGYLVGLEFFILCNMPDREDNPDLPMYFHPGLGPLDRDEFAQKVRGCPEVHKGALKQAQRLLKQPRWANADVVQHLPWG
jgi:hypothetical protein